MSETPVFYLLRPERVEPASSTRSWLGRIIKHYASPDASFTPSDPKAILSDLPFSETKIADASVFMRGTASQELSFKLSGLASAFQNRGQGTGVEFSTTEIKYVRLQNHDKALRALCENPEVMADLNRMLKPGGEPAYMIVGMLIWSNASFIDLREHAKGVGGSVELPVAAAVAGSTGVLLPDLVNPSVGAATGTVHGRALAGFSEGSSIFAFEYRTIRRRVYSLSRNFQPRLGGWGRIEKDRVFGDHDKKNEAHQCEVENSVVELDEEESQWIDLVEEEPEVEDIGDIKVAFDIEQ
jgi:hypothetical protein